MKKPNLLASGVILSLITSNFILLSQYKTDMGQYQKEIDHQSKIIKQHEVIIHKQKVYINRQTKVVKDLQTNLENENKEISQLKKQLTNKKDVNIPRKLNMTLTFYGADCEGCSGITKTGIDVSDTVYYKGYHVIAADPRVIPLRSIIRIETKNRTFYGYVCDTGSAIKGNILDVLVSSESEAFNYGRQNAVITVMKEGVNL